MSNKYRQPPLYSALAGTVMWHDKVVPPGESSGSPPLDVEDSPLPPVAEHRDDGGKRDLKMEAKSLSHLMAYLPKNPHCEICQRAKMENALSYRGEGQADHAFEKFGDHITLRTMVLHSLKNRGIRGETDTVLSWTLPRIGLMTFRLTTAPMPRR